MENETDAGAVAARALAGVLAAFPGATHSRVSGDARSRFGHVTIALPNGQTFTIKVEEGY
jgi:hypothetical protein